MEYMRESIIVASIRSLCRAFAVLVGVVAALVLITIVFALFSTPDLYPPKSTYKIAPDAEGNRELLPLSTPAILKLDIVGVIGQGDLVAAKIRNVLSDSREGILSGDRVKAILLYIDTPGGGIDDIHGIYTALLEYKAKYHIPVYAFVDGLCASGGMYIACAADQVFATQTSIVGSVGVILGPAFNFSGLMDRYGVQALALTQGKDKDMLSPFRPWVPGEDQSLRTITAGLYDQFVSIVTDARTRMSREKLVNEYGAQVFLAKTAEQYGYIDNGDASYMLAVGELVKKASLEGHPYQVVTVGPCHPFFAELAEGKLGLLKGTLTHQIQIDPSIPPELQGKFLYLYQPR